MEIMDILPQLIPNVWTVITQLCASAILFFLMYKLAYKPVKNIMNKRSEYEQAKIDEANKLKEDNEKLALEAKENISKAKEEASKIMDDATNKATDLQNKLIEDGKKQVAQMVAQASDDINLKKQEMIDEVSDQMSEIALKATEKILKKEVSKADDKAQIEAFIKEINDEQKK